MASLLKKPLKLALVQLASGTQYYPLNTANTTNTTQAPTKQSISPTPAPKSSKPPKQAHP